MTFGEEMSVAPAGSDVLREDEREQQEQVDIDTSAIRMASGSEEVETPRVDVPPAPDTSHLSMGEVGEDIPNLDEEVEIVEPDISGIDLAPEGSDMLEEKDRHKDEVEAPNTDHLSLKD